MGSSRWSRCGGRPGLDAVVGAVEGAGAASSADVSAETGDDDGTGGEPEGAAGAVGGDSESSGAVAAVGVDAAVDTPPLAVVAGDSTEICSLAVEGGDPVDACPAAALAGWDPVNACPGAVVAGSGGEWPCATGVGPVKAVASEPVPIAVSPPGCVDRGAALPAAGADPADASAPAQLDRASPGTSRSVAVELPLADAVAPAAADPGTAGASAPAGIEAGAVEAASATVVDPRPPDAPTATAVVPEPASGVRSAGEEPADVGDSPEDGVESAGVGPRGVTRTRAGLPMTPNVEGTASSRISTSTWSERRPSWVEAAAIAAPTVLALASAWATRLALSGRAAARPPVAAGALPTALP
jgi:hypothetical protein